MDISEVNTLYHQGRSNETCNRLVLLQATIAHLKANNYPPDAAIYDNLTKNVDVIDLDLVSPFDREFVKLFKETAEMYRFYRNGKTLQEIADWYGTSRQAVQQRFKRYGLARHASSTEAASAARWADKELNDTTDNN